MNKKELFIEGCKAHRWKWRTWRISLFAVVKLPTDTEYDPDVPETEMFDIYTPEPFDIDYRDDGIYWFDPKLSDWQRLEGADPTKPLFNYRCLTKFPEGSVPNHDGPIETTYGRMLFNWMVLFYSFGTKIPFQQKTNGNAIVSMFVDRAYDDDYVPASPDEVYFTASEVAKFVKMMFEFFPMCPYITPTGTARTLTTHPEVEALRDQLLAGYGNGRVLTAKDVAEIQEKLIAKDIEWLSQDESIDYYIDRKSIAVKRKKLFLLHGLETAFREDGGFTLIAKPLYKGTDLTKLPEVFNAVREGSYNRGADTALGGEKVTFLQRIYQNVKIVPGDCGTKLLYHFTLNKYNAHAYVGLNMFDGKNYVELTSDLVKQYMGKPIAIRRPMLCKAPHTDFCEVCSGKQLARQPRAVAAEISNVGSDVMYAFMSAMHGVELSVADYDPIFHIR